jgi:hypothetical protein
MVKRYDLAVIATDENARRVSAEARLAEETERGNYWFDQSNACEEEIKRLRALLGRVVGTPLSSRTADGGTLISGELLRDIEAGLGTTVSGNARTGSKK